MEGSDRRTKLRSFAIGGVLGAAGAIATVRRSSRRRKRATVGGLAAFEEAPCYRELVGGETTTGTSKPT
jgi:hypothetical protein